MHRFDNVQRGKKIATFGYGPFLFEIFEDPDMPYDERFVGWCDGIYSITADDLDMCMRALMFRHVIEPDILKYKPSGAKIIDFAAARDQLRGKDGIGDRVRQEREDDLFRTR